MMDGIENAVQRLPVTRQRPQPETSRSTAQKLEHGSPPVPSVKPLRAGSPPPLIFALLTSGLRSWFGLSTMMALFVVIVRISGVLQSLELKAFDQLLRDRPEEAQDQRLLLVTLTEEDAKRYTSTESLTPSRASLPEQAYSEIFAQLDRFKPISIGLDIYRDFQTKAYVDQGTPKFKKLFKHLNQNPNLFFICEVPDPEAGQKGVKPPYGVLPERIGFNDVIEDPMDGVIRRHLVKMESSQTEGCHPTYALSFKLARHYLQAKKMELEQTSAGYDRIGNAVFTPLVEYAGGYQNIDARGTQILLNYRVYDGSPREIAPEITLDQLLNDQNGQLANQYQDRIILIGFIDQAEEFSRTPFGTQKIPGLYIHAQMVSQILSAADPDEHRPFLWVWPSNREDVLWIWVWCLWGGGMGWWWRSRPFVLLLLQGISVLVLYVTCYCVLSFLGGWLPLVPPAIALVGTGWVGFAYTRVEEQRKSQVSGNR